MSRKLFIQIIEPLQDIEAKKLLQSGYFPISEPANEIIQERINNSLPFECLDMEGSIFNDDGTASHFDITFIIENEEYMICGVNEECLNIDIL